MPCDCCTKAFAHVIHTVLCISGCSRDVAAAAAKDIQQRLGGRGALMDFVKTLIGRLVPNLVCPEHVTALLDLAKEVGLACGQAR